MKKFVAASMLLLVGGVAHAATTLYNITGANWESVQTFSTNADGTPDTVVTDNSDLTQVPLFGGAPNAISVWSNLFNAGSVDVGPVPVNQSGSWSGQIEVDDATGEIVSGTLANSGTISKTVVVAGSSWWLIQVANLSVNFGTGAATGSGACADNLIAGSTISPVACSQPPGATNPGPGAVVGSEPFASWAAVGGFETDQAGVDGAARFGGFFDPTTGALRTFSEGRTGTDGTDYGNNLSTTFSVVPVPAAVWLFGSALGLLGWVRRRAAS